MLTVLFASMLSVLASGPSNHHSSFNALEAAATDYSVRPAQSDKVFNAISDYPLEDKYSRLLKAKKLELKTGKRETFCQEILRNLNALPHPAYGRGEWPIVIESSSLSKPNWADVDANKYRDIIRRLYKNTRDGLRDSAHPPQHIETDEEIEKRIDEAIRSGDGKLQMAVFTFDQDQYPDQVFRYSDNPNPETEYGLPGRYWRLAVNVGAPEGNNEKSDRLLTLPFYDVLIIDGHGFVMRGGLGNIYVDEIVYIPTEKKIGLGIRSCSTRAVLEKP